MNHEELKQEAKEARDELSKMAQLKNGDELLLGITKDMKILNNTTSPDEALGIISYLTYNIIRMISSYTESVNDGTYEEKDIELPIMKYNDLRDQVTKMMDTYNLTYSGFTAEEAFDIMGMNKDAYSIHDVKQKDNQA